MKTEQQIHTQEKIDQAIATIVQKMKLINFNNFQPPYLLHTLIKFRETYFSKFLKEIKLEGQKDQVIREKLKTVHYLIEKFDDECFDIYSSQLIQPYIRKMFQDNYQFDGIQFKQVNIQYNLQSQIQQTLTQASEWLCQIQVTQDLLSRIDLYFKIKCPNISEKVREEGLQSQKGTWTGSFMSGVRKLLSFGLRKGAKMITSTFFTAVAPAALMLTLAIMGGMTNIPWKGAMTTKNLVTSAAIVAVPFLLDSMAQSVQKVDYKIKLKNWALTFEALSESIRKFNNKLEESLRNCTLSANKNQFLIQRTNLQKIINDLNKNLQSVTSYDQKKLQQMRQRTQAYFKQYLQIKQDQWTLVLTKQQEKEQQNKKLQTKQNEQQNQEFTLL